MDSRDFHPIANEYPMMPAVELERMAKGMKDSGFDKRFPILLFEKKILDGRNRYAAAEKADVEPVYAEFQGTEEEARDFVRIANEERRHLAKDWLTERRGERVKRIAEARKAGKSTRAIAEEEGISQPQVLRDLKSTDTGEVSVDGGKVTDKRGRKHAAQKPLILCERCTLQAPGVGIPGCPACKDARKPKEKPKPAKAKPAAVGSNGEAVPQDAFGNEIPKKRQDAYADPFLQTTIDFLGEISSKFWEGKLAQGLKKRHKAYPFMNLHDFTDGCAQAGNPLDDLLKHLKGNRPAAVCPMCDGKGCSDCQMSGLIPRRLYKELKLKAKEAKRKAAEEAQAEADKSAKEAMK